MFKGKNKTRENEKKWSAEFLYSIAHTKKETMRASYNKMRLNSQENCVVEKD